RAGLRKFPAPQNAAPTHPAAKVKPDKQFHGVAARTPALSSYCEEAEMHRTSYSILGMLVIVLGTTVVLGQAPAKRATSGEPTKTEDFATAIKKIRDTWVQEFNAGHADKVADLYAQE